MHRIVEKLLHTPTVRVKEMAEGGQGGSYAQALRELFDLAPARRLGRLHPAGHRPVTDDEEVGR